MVSLFLHGLGQVFSLDGRQLVPGYHGLSHHGNDPVVVRDLVAIESAHMHCRVSFLKRLNVKKTPEGKTLLDDTIVLVGPGMGDASRHSNANLPTLVDWAAATEVDLWRRVVDDVEDRRMPPPDAEPAALLLHPRRPPAQPTHNAPAPCDRRLP